ncbi:hypothetical protein C2142_10100 [Streptomyces sp. CB01881]|nr:hypothetical protein C2142_10100 [Streptomyces sp. CB01881]
MPTPKIVIAPPPMPAPFQRADLQGPYDTALAAVADAQAALAAAALEVLAATARAFRPRTASIEFTSEAGGPRIQALWPEVRTILVTLHRRELWRRREDERISLRDHLQIQDMEGLLPDALNVSGLPVAPMGAGAPARRLLRLPAPDVAGTLAARIRSQHPAASALLISLDSENGTVDIAVEHIVGPDGTSVAAIPRDRDFAPSPQEAWWWRSRDETVWALRHLWRHPQHRARYFRPQGSESQMWNNGLQAVLLPAIPALPAGKAA